MSAQPKTALITGITGQDGWYLARHLLELGYEVTGSTHRAQARGALHIGHSQIPVVHLDLGSWREVESVVSTRSFTEIYNLAARSSSAQLFDDPLATTDVNGQAVARLLEAIRRHSPTTKLCQASSSEVFAGTTTSPQDESTPLAPRSAYGAAKAFADHLVAAYRAEHGLFAASAILFSHESPRRSLHFLVRKVTNAAARIADGQETRVTVGNLDAIRDWGFAGDFVEGMTMMLQSETPRDYVLATGEAHTVRDVCETAFAHVGLEWAEYVHDDLSATRPTDLAPRVGNPTKAVTELGWSPTMSFHELVAYMVDADRIAN